MSRGTDNNNACIERQKLVYRLTGLGWCCGQDYSAYISFVTRQTGFSSRKKVPLDDDGVLLAFGKAMFEIP